MKLYFQQQFFFLRNPNFHITKEDPRFKLQGLFPLWQATLLRLVCNSDFKQVVLQINSHDDDGVVVGRWDGDYKGGVAPFDWTGSALIMDKYLRNGGKPVKYGQCWVFSAVVVTVCRALGIPCRSVTNFVSAHDTDSNMTIDKCVTGRNV